MRKKLTALLVAAILLFTYFPRIKAAGSVWFIAVNDNVPMTLTRETQPFRSNEVLYIPYTVFKAKPFNVAISYNEDKKQNLTLFNRIKTLHFDLLKEIATDKDGNVSDVDVVFRNGVLYIPANCLEYFDIDVVLLQNPDGYYVLRLTNGKQIYDDDVLLARAEQLIKTKAEQYDAGTLEPETENPDTQKPDNGNGYDPGVEPDGYAYLVFWGESVSDLSVRILEGENLFGAFFLTEDQILENPALVRMIYAAGNTVGVTVSEGEQNVREALDAANAALDETIFRKTVLALVPEALAYGAVEGYRMVVSPTETLEEPEIDQPDEVNTEAEEATVRMLIVNEPNIYNSLSNLLQENVGILQLRESSPIA